MQSSLKIPFFIALISFTPFICHGMEQHALSKALFNACEENNINQIKQLLEEKASVHAQNILYNQTPLHRAVWNHNICIIELLINNDANVNQPDEDGETPLHIAAYDGSAHIIQILIEHNAEVNQTAKNGNTPLHKAAGLNHVDAIPILIDARFNHADAIQILINNKANINQPNKDGQTPLHKAIHFNKTDTIKIFLSHGAIVDDTSINKAARNPQIQSMLKQAPTMQKESQHLLPMLRLFMYSKNLPTN